MKYYFLTNDTQTFISGPFITVANTVEKYVGQIVRSNDFSVKVQNNSLKLYLWCCDFEPTLTNQQIKSKLINLLPKLSEAENIELIVKFEDTINYSSGPYPSIKATCNSTKYVLEFKCLNDIFYCPTLNIYF